MKSVRHPSRSKSQQFPFSSILFLLCLVVISLWFFIGRSEYITVAIGEEGYMPRDVTITPGTRVIFRNNSSSDKWPVSDIQQNQKVYSNIDSRQAITPGASWEFVFEEKGVWHYRDHLYPSQTGTIRVE